jgi:hypothetical protein
MAKRPRLTITVREDDPVPRQRGKKKRDSRALFIILLLIVFGLIFLGKNHGAGPQLPRPAALSR